MERKTEREGTYGAREIRHQGSDQSTTTVSTQHQRQPLLAQPLVSAMVEHLLAELKDLALGCVLWPIDPGFAHEALPHGSEIETDHLQPIMNEILRQLLEHPTISRA